LIRVKVFDGERPVERPAPKHLRVAPRVSKRVLRQRRRARFAIAGVAAISALSMFLLVTFHVFAVGASFQLDKLEHRRVAAQRENELLRNRVATLSSATTIFAAAVRIGMVRADPTQITVDGSGVSVPSPSPAPVEMPLQDYKAIARRRAVGMSRRARRTPPRTPNGRARARARCAPDVGQSGAPARGGAASWS